MINILVSAILIFIFLFLLLFYFGFVVWDAIAVAIIISLPISFLCSPFNLLTTENSACYIGFLVWFLICLIYIYCWIVFTSISRMNSCGRLSCKVNF